MADIKAAFEARDTDAKGLISRVELVELLKQLDSTFNDARIDKLLLQSDLNKGGMIDYKRFVDWLLQPENSPPAFVEFPPGSKHFCLDPEGEESRFIASKIWFFGPKFSPKDVPAFYDISSITEDAVFFKRVIDLFVDRYRAMGDAGPTHVLGYDARGFVLGPPISLALGIPFVLFRKDAKHPGVLVESSGYAKEYVEAKLDKMCMRLGSIQPPAQVLLIDDLVATGGTALAGFELCNSCGIDVLEFAAVIDLPVCEGVKKIREYGGGRFKDIPVFTLIDGSTVPAENCKDPSEWAEDSRVVPAPDAKAMLEKYPNLV